MQYVVEIRKISNPNFPASIGILERQVYEKIHGAVHLDNENVVVSENPDQLIQGLETRMKPLTVFNGGRAYMIKAEFEEEVRGLFQKIKGEAAN